MLDGSSSGAANVRWRRCFWCLSVAAPPEMRVSWWWYYVIVCFGGGIDSEYCKIELIPLEFEYGSHFILLRHSASALDTAAVRVVIYIYWFHFWAEWDLWWFWFSNDGFVSSSFSQFRFYGKAVAKLRIFLLEISGLILLGVKRTIQRLPNHWNWWFERWWQFQRS